MNDIFQYWESKIAKEPEPLLVEAGFLRSYICFEEFMRDIFISFSLGKNYKSYTPSRSLCFNSENQLMEVIRGEASFVDYYKAIERCSKHIFTQDPFPIVFSDSCFSQPLLQMRVLRNYLAHRSAESKERYISKVLSSYGFSENLEPGDFLLRKMKNGTVTYYNHYMEVLRRAHSALTDEAILKGN